MKKIVDNKIFKVVRMILVIASMFFLPSLFSQLLSKTFIKNSNIISLISLILYLILLFGLFYKDLINEIKIFMKNFKKNADIGFKWWMIGLIVMLVSNIILNLLVFKGSIAANEEANRSALLSNAVFAMLSSVLIAPILEEIIFRKNLNDVFKSTDTFAIVSGAIFGFCHVTADLSSLFNLLYIIPYGALGYVFAKMDRETNTTFTSVFMHMTHNFITSILVLCLVR